MKKFKKDKQDIKHKNLPKSKALNSKPTMPESKNIVGDQYEEVIRTTDAMNLISTAAQSSEDMSNQLAQSAEAITRNYELARRKITSIYSEVISSGNYVASPFLSIQIILREYAEGWEIKKVEKTIDKFFTVLFDVLSEGNTVRLTPEFLIEAVYYANKILPSAKIIPSVTTEIKLFEWEQVFERGLAQEKLLHTDKKIIATLIEAIEANVNVGYYVRMGDVIISRIRADRPDLVLLFSNQWLQELNNKHKQGKVNAKRKRVSKTNWVESFSKTQKELKEGKEEVVTEEKEIPQTSVVKDIDVNNEPEREVPIVMNEEPTVNTKAEKKAEVKDAKKNKRKEKADKMEAYLAEKNNTKKAKLDKKQAKKDEKAKALKAKEDAKAAKIKAAEDKKAAKTKELDKKNDNTKAKDLAKKDEKAKALKAKEDAKAAKIKAAEDKKAAKTKAKELDKKKAKELAKKDDKKKADKKAQDKKTKK